jgi:hypothetical protein
MEGVDDLDIEPGLLSEQQLKQLLMNVNFRILSLAFSSKYTAKRINNA